jgi:dipeptidyl aminopeptidase/acylaminoacyl peptidase
MLKIILSIILGLIIVLLGWNMFLRHSQNTVNEPSLFMPSTSSEVKATPFPFQEMTIPVLRAREYKSSLNDLSEVGQNSNYTSYLTSYESDGFKINGLLTIPSGDKPAGGWPAIVFVHGYIPPSTYQTQGQAYSAYVDYLAKNGFVVFKIDLRGHGDSEGEAGGGYFGSDYIVDTLNARAALMNSDFVNKDAVGLWGHSMAGNILMRSLAAQPTIPAVVIWGGAVYTYADQLKYGINDNSYRPPSDQSQNRNKRAQLIAKYGQFDPNNEFWKQVPATNYLDGIKGAISLNHAVDDDVVNIGYSRDLNAILDKTLIPHELNEYPGGGHNISGTNFTKAMENTVNFFDRYLKK